MRTKKSLYSGRIVKILSLLVGILLSVVSLPASAAGNPQQSAASNAVSNFVPARQGITEMESPVVCSPGTHPTCLPGPASEKVTAPDNVSAVRIDVYWGWSGKSSSVQPNEHSWFSVAVNNDPAGKVYCPDAGDGVTGDVFCDSKRVDVSPGDQLTLTIRHADEEPGPTPGSHFQRWVLNWIAAPPPATPTEVPPTPTEVPPSPTPTEMTPEVTETPVENTPTPTDEVSPPTGITPTPTEEVSPPEDTPEATPTDVVSPPEAPQATRTPIPTLPPPAPPAKGTPPALVPITGGDSAGGLNQGLFLNLGVGLLGLVFIVYGIKSKLKR